MLRAQGKAKCCNTNLSAVVFVQTSKGNALTDLFYQFLVVWIVMIFSGTQTTMFSGDQDISKYNNPL